MGFRFLPQGEASKKFEPRVEEVQGRGEPDANGRVHPTRPEQLEPREEGTLARLFALRTGSKKDGSPATSVGIVPQPLRRAV